MSKQKGKFIVIEGTDGSGKTVQFNKLVERLKKESRNVATFDFPQYDKPSSFFIKEYLNGRYGGWKQVGPYKASVFYAIDRLDADSRIKEALRQGKIVVSNRYVASNMGHQGAKIGNKKERMKFLKWLDELEFCILGIPRPDINIVLHVPAEIAQKLVDKKGRREYIGGIKRDIHEQDLKHLKQAEQTYLEIARAFPNDFILIECVKSGKLLSVDEIHKKIWQTIQKILK
jgi:dTMP kinase